MTETVNRVKRAGATGPVTVRADSGFWSYRLIADLDDLGVEWSVTIPQHSQIKAAIAAIEETEWEPIDYPEGGEAQVAETAFCASKKGKRRRVRVVVRRTRLTDSAQAQLWPDWRYHGVRHQHQTTGRTSRCLSPGPCPHGVGHTRPQTPRRVVPLPVWELLRQRRLAFLRHPCSQPLPMDRTPHPPGRTTNQRQHRPHPTVHTARKDRKPRTKTDPAPSHPMAMGQHLPHRPGRRPQPTATLLTPAHSPPNKPSANVSHRFRTSPHAPDPTEHPNKPAEPRQNLTHPHKTTPRHTPQPQKRPHHPDRTPRSVDSG